MVWLNEQNDGTVWMGSSFSETVTYELLFIFDEMGRIDVKYFRRN